MGVAVDCPDASVPSKVETDCHEGDCQVGAVMRGHAVMRGTFNECLPVLRALGVQEQAQKWCGECGSEQPGNEAEEENRNEVSSPRSPPTSRVAGFLCHNPFLVCMVIIF